MPKSPARKTMPLLILDFDPIINMLATIKPVKKKVSNKGANFSGKKPGRKKKDNSA
ncbi:MAG: hypothetical protein KFF73_01150 [Cyclobacteriaceae bacterium]|nr:hypothetical protein [Cyclobacteriaceae bacterium]